MPDIAAALSTSLHHAHLAHELVARLGEPVPEIGSLTAQLRSIYERLYHLHGTLYSAPSSHAGNIESAASQLSTALYDVKVAIRRFMERDGWSQARGQIVDLEREVEERMGALDAWVAYVDLYVSHSSHYNAAGHVINPT